MNSTPRPYRMTDDERVRRAEVMRARNRLGSWNNGLKTGLQTAEHRAKILATRVATLSDPERHRVFIDRCRAAGVKGVLAQASRKTSRPESYICGVLDALDVDYVYQAAIEGMAVDFYIPSLRLIVEFDGVYWHASTPDHSARRDAVLHAAGYKVLRLNEQDDLLKILSHETQGAARKADIIAEVVSS